METQKDLSPAKNYTADIQNKHMINNQSKPSIKKPKLVSRTKDEYSNNNHDATTDDQGCKNINENIKMINLKRVDNSKSAALKSFINGLSLNNIRSTLNNDRNSQAERSYGHMSTYEKFELTKEDNQKPKNIFKRKPTTPSSSSSSPTPSIEDKGMQVNAESTIVSSMNNFIDENTCSGYEEEIISTDRFQNPKRANMQSFGYPCINGLVALARDSCLEYASSGSKGHNNFEVTREDIQEHNKNNHKRKPSTPSSLSSSASSPSLEDKDIRKQKNSSASSLIYVGPRVKYTNRRASLSLVSSVSEDLDVQSLDKTVELMRDAEHKRADNLAEAQNHVGQVDEIIPGNSTNSDTPSCQSDRSSPLPLKNLGNTCYENSIIQCLFALEPFMQDFERTLNDVKHLIVKSKSKPTHFQSFTHNSTNTDDCTALESNKSYNLVNDAMESMEVDEITIPTPTETKNHPQPDSSDTKMEISVQVSNDDNQALTSNQTDVSGQRTNIRTISEDDVRFRIADAFHNLYKCYKFKRLQESSNNQIESCNKDSNSDTHRPQTSENLTAIDGSTSNKPSGPVAIPLCKSSNTTVNNESPNDTNKSNLTTTVNLTPLDLVSTSAATNEQSEIDSKLEGLKSAVGERSSQFNSTHQQDASEFFYHVIDSIQEFYQHLDKYKEEENPVTKAFELELDYRIKCPKCQHSINSEPGRVRTLHLAVPQSEVQPKNDNYNHDVDSLPTPPNSDLGLDSPNSDNSEERRANSEEKENRASVSKDITVFDHEDKNTSINVNTQPCYHPVSIANLDLLVGNNDNNGGTNINHAKQRSRQKKFTLNDALVNYFKEDVMESKCSQPGCDSKERLRLCLVKKLPQVLFMTIARYSYTGKKNQDEVEAPLTLKVPPTSFDDKREHDARHQDQEADSMIAQPNLDHATEYRLVAVVCHLGTSLYAGHYTSYVFNTDSSEWYSCDDDSITKANECDVLTDASKSGYCFFYAKPN